MVDSLTPDEKHTLTKIISEVHEQSWGIAFGLVLGLGLLISTDVLVLKGGEVVGPHLAVLSVYLPGYSVSLVGSVIGFVYAFVIGYGMGRSVATIYNRLTVRMRS